jgi:hypothetical protein
MQTINGKLSGSYKNIFRRACASRKYYNLANYYHKLSESGFAGF